MICVGLVCLLVRGDSGMEEVLKKVAGLGVSGMSGWKQKQKSLELFSEVTNGSERNNGPRDHRYQITGVFCQGHHSSTRSFGLRDIIWKPPGAGTALDNSKSPEQKSSFPSNTGTVWIRPHLSVKETFITPSEISVSLDSSDQSLQVVICNNKCY